MLQNIGRLLSRQQDVVNAFFKEQNKILDNKYKMQGKENNKIGQAFQQSQQMQPLFGEQPASSLPFTQYQDSLSFVPDYSLLNIGNIDCGGAFVVEDNYLFTWASNYQSYQHGEWSFLNRTKHCPKIGETNTTMLFFTSKGTEYERQLWKYREYNFKKGEKALMIVNFYDYDKHFMELQGAYLTKIVH